MYIGSKAELGALNVPTIEGITNCHNIEFGVNAIKAWRYYKIGEGKEIPIKDFEMDLTYTVVRNFPDAFPTGFKTRIKEPSTSAKEGDKGVTILECPEENCVCTFEKMEALNTHLLGQLHSSEDTHILDSKSKMRLYFAEYMSKTASSEATTPSSSAIQTESASGHSGDVSNIECKGWALPHRKKPVRLTEKQKKWLTDMFVEGERTRRKKTPNKVADLMKTVRHEGKKIFHPREYLKNTQIMGFFS